MTVPCQIHNIPPFLWNKNFGECGIRVEQSSLLEKWIHKDNLRYKCSETLVGVGGWNFGGLFFIKLP